MRDGNFKLEAKELFPFSAERIDSIDEFERKKLSFISQQKERLVELPTNQWAELAPDTSLCNEEVSTTCLMLYIRDPLTGRLLAGHFEKTHEDERRSGNVEPVASATTRSGVAISEGGDARMMTYYYPAVERYREMLERAKEMKPEQGRVHLEAYLLGQDPRGANDLETGEFARGVAERMKVTMELNALGMEVHDLRSHGAGATLTDSFYNSRERKLYFFDEALSKNR